MPVMDGYTATRAIRAQARWKDLPVIAMTANAMAGDRDKVLAAGMLDHIPKPLDGSEMFATMARWIRPARGRVPAAVTPQAAALQADASAAPPFPALPGIDTVAGIGRTMGDAGLYRRLLLKFRQSQGDFDALFRGALAGTDPEGATRVAHTLKGTAGNIGARGVQAAAAALEDACARGAMAEELEAGLQQVLAALSPVLTGLRNLEAAVPTVAAGDPGQLAAGIAQLRTLLRDNDPEAATLACQLAELAQGTPDGEALADLARAVESYDFDSALALLGRLAVGTG